MLFLAWCIPPVTLRLINRAESELEWMTKCKIEERFSPLGVRVRLGELEFKTSFELQVWAVLAQLTNTFSKCLRLLQRWHPDCGEPKKR